MPEETVWSKFFNVENILSVMQVDESIHDLMEAGCGYGTFTIAAAKRITGKVFAFDIDPGMITSTKQRALSDNIRNIELFNRDFIADGTGKSENSIDYVMLFNILHHDKPKELLIETYRILKKGGKAGIIHWRSDIETPRGPELSIRPTPEQCVEWSIQNGFMIAKEPDVLEPFHFGLIIQKP